RLTSTYTLGTGATGSGAELSYDKMGRTVLYAQCGPSTCGDFSYNTTYSYDLAGDLTSVGNGSGARDGSSTATISYHYDNALRVDGVTSSFVDSEHPSTLASGFIYSPTGPVSKFVGINGVTETEVYNSRLQLCRLNYQTSSTPLAGCTGGPPSGN